MIHRMARDAIDDESIMKFVIFMTSVCTYLSCNECSSHCKEYLSSHPFNPYYDIRDNRDGRLIGMFVWSWIFHNDVNRRLNKNPIDWQRAVNIYYSEI